MSEMPKKKFHVSIMGCPFRVVNFVMLFITAQIEVVALYFLIKLLFSHCVLGEEYGISVWLYLFFLPVITLQSVLLAFFRLFCNTVGLDPIAMLFNFVSGLVCIGTSVTLLVASVTHCGNGFRYMFFVSSCLGFLAGVLHIINACLCNSYMPKDEWMYAKPSKRTRMRETGYRPKETMRMGF